MIAHKSLTLGAGLLVLGLFVLFVVVSGENLLMVFMPFLMIGFGVLLMISPTLLPSNANRTIQFIGEYRQHYCNTIDDHAIVMGMGDVDLDFSHISLPSGDTLLKIYCFAGGVRLKFRDGLAYRIHSRAFVGEVHADGKDEELIVAAYQKNTPDYPVSGQRLDIEIYSFVSEITIQ